MCPNPPTTSEFRDAVSVLVFAAPPLPAAGQRIDNAVVLYVAAIRAELGLPAPRLKSAQAVVARLNYWALDRCHAVLV
jgi:hypothetical protein